MPELANPLTLRVYWEDTDAGGVVFYANYLKFFERARTEWLRRHGVAQSQLQAEAGIVFVVASTNVRYLAPARLDDVLHISVQVQQLGSASMEFMQQAWRGDTLLCEGAVRVGCVAAATLRPQRLPATLLATLRQASAAPA